ncbi:MAG: SapC family protein [Alphaproteobacteria bacterium]|nr:SapC family protein [Alphaproteobacteria bacterium]
MAENKPRPALRPAATKPAQAQRPMAPAAAARPAAPAPAATAANTAIQRPAEQRPGLPLFYKDPRPLARDRHAGKSLKNTASLSFAANSNAVPVTLEEFGIASRHYPIVFSMEKPAVAVAVLGFRRGENLFIDGQGRWAPESYVPGYIRRYPFIFMEMKERNQYMLCVDEAANLLEDNGTRPLFEGNQPSDLTKRALEFCAAYHRQSVLTQRFAEAIESHGLLSDKGANVTVPGGQTIALQGIRQIDQDKFRTLPDSVILEWHKNGFLFAIHAHFISLGNWPGLGQRLGRLLRTVKPVVVPGTKPATPRPTAPAGRA